MTDTAHTHLHLIKKGKSFFQIRLLFLLWAVFFSVLISYLTPSPQETGYKHVFTLTAVKGVHTERETVASLGHVAFLSQEIVEKKFIPSPTPTPKPPRAEKQYGKSRQIGEYTWTIDVPDDATAGTAREIFDALNAYRQKNGEGKLSWNDRLASFAQSRANLFHDQQKTDGHAGFMDYLNNQDGFAKFGFLKVGENSSLGYRVSGVRLIEEVYAGDKPHDENQLSPDWSSVGVGVNGEATDLIFAGSPR